jgi:hypothetical protein
MRSYQQRGFTSLGKPSTATVGRRRSSIPKRLGVQMEGQQFRLRRKDGYRGSEVSVVFFGS